MEGIPQKPELGKGKEFIIDQARTSRLKRVNDQKNEAAAIVIQNTIRRYVETRKFRKSCFLQIENLLAGFDAEKKDNAHALDVFLAAYFLVKRFNNKTDVVFLEKLCRYIIWSLQQESCQYSYIGVGLKKTLSIYWINHLKEIITVCVSSIALLKPELLADSKQLSIFLSTLVVLTSVKGWCLVWTKSMESLRPGMEKLSLNMAVHMCEHTPFYESLNCVLQAALSRPGRFAVKKANLQAIATLANRPITEEFPSQQKLISLYIRNILTVPAYIFHVNNLCSEALEEKLFSKFVSYASIEKNLSEITQGKDLSLILALLANLIQLGERYSKEQNLAELFYPKFSTVISGLMKECNALNEQPKSKTHWHPIFGWVVQPIPASFLNSVEQFRTQVEFLWSPNYIDSAFAQLFEFSATNRLLTSVAERPAKKPIKGVIVPQKSPPSTVKASLLKAVKRVFSLDASSDMQAPHVVSNSSACSSYQPYLKFSNDISIRVAEACQLYTAVIKTLPICKIDILTGLCFKNSSKTLVVLWKFVHLLDKDKTSNWVDVILAKPTQIQEELIVLFADAMIHFTTILDDQEMYEDQKVFTLAEFSELAQFINRLCYRLISHPNHSRIKDKVWKSLKTLLVVLYRRDCRKRFCSDDNWLIETNKMNQLISDIEKGRKNAKRILLDMPHVLREEARVVLFRKWAASEKQLNGNSAGDLDSQTGSGNSTLVTIQRGRIVEDGYAQLATLSPKALKGTIRVRFQNALGLDEAGIDQDGVFKEFLEETINAVFNPTLNLFKATSENLLYPAPLSYLHENYLQLFEFVGKMLAKAIYEGIVVDVHFAPFFLSQILGHQQNALFSAIDELQSLDLELYKSLNYIKHYEGNVQDLELTFSVDQDVLGQIKTTELIPGGSTLPVTNDNKISYLYLMAHFHLSMQIKEQTAAFLKGFRSIIPFEWIRIFSPIELQRLISGEDTDIDLQDLRRNTQYYGGFHDNHRVICWLWEILEHDFYEQERRQFLKFVTSCSKPPLLGFVNMDPPFSIRCVEVSDDEDTGDTIGKGCTKGAKVYVKGFDILGSVLRGFLTIGKKDPVGRLPTSSTCFNLLKLPNYHKKSTLRDKLRYAISAHVGFELS